MKFRWRCEPRRLTRASSCRRPCSEPFVGIVPVAIGLMFYPALRGVGSRGMSFLLALTIGLLAFLFVDSLEDALELAGEAPPPFM